MARKRRQDYPESYDDSKPKKLQKTKNGEKGLRLISDKVMPPGRNTCNAKLTSRDGYCQSPGVASFYRCATHGGKTALKPYDVFSKALSVNNAAKLQGLLEDVLNMDNELASGKVMLTNSIENWQRGEMVLEEYISTMPTLPNIQDGMMEPEELQAYEQSVNLHKFMINKTEKYVKQNFDRAQSLLKTLTDGVAKNHKMKEGNKFTLDVKQIRDILQSQLEVMSDNCAGCPTLKTVVTQLREKFSDLEVVNVNTKANRKAAQRKAYKDALKTVEEEIPDAVEVDAEIISVEDLE